MAESQDMSGDVTLMDIVAEVEEGDEFEIYAWECRVVRVVDCEARPWLEVQKKSVGGFMKRTYRLEWADPTDEDDETLAMKADRKSGWDVRFECDPSDVELENEPVATEASTDSEPVVMTDGGVDQSENETHRQHLYLITSHPNEKYVGLVESREKPYVVAEKNAERRVDKRDLESGEGFTMKVVGLGYHDFESKDPDPDHFSRVSKQKLAEIDDEILEKAGVELEVTA